ncbi:XLF-domain-containing protein [Xylariaceae sp. FL0016]|nr:XLF-domain-containing protein [Xylariaceae sp. FL0016]
MDSPARWYPLPAFRDLPPLLVSPRFASTSYTVHVTDLANIWVESLDRKGILLRSLQEETSIDLSDPADPEQWTVFFSKLKSTFIPASSEDRRLTSFSLSASSTASAEPGLILRVRCVLPKPLEPLDWPFHLQKCNPASLASELVLPLVQAHHDKMQEEADLIDRLKDKDAVIAKLVDKLAVVGHGLENVFNVSGRLKTTRAAIEEKVSGLARFDEKEWRSTQNNAHDKYRDMSTLIQGAFGGRGPGCDLKSGIGVSGQINDWWTNLSSEATVSNPEQEQSSVTQEPEPPSNESGLTEGEDADFQVQATPPHLQMKFRTSRTRKPNITQDEADSTDGDEQVVIPDSHPHDVRYKARARIGLIGGERPGQGNSASQSSRTITMNEEETASESEQDSEARKTRIGRIGIAGKIKRPATPPMGIPRASSTSNHDDETASGSGTESDEQARPPSASKSALDLKPGSSLIGEKRKSVPPEPKEATTERIETEDHKHPSSTRSTTRRIGVIGKSVPVSSRQIRAQPPPEHETQDQKAERKRTELAKELERKATAPAKKKRKF